MTRRFVRTALGIASAVLAVNGIAGSRPAWGFAFFSAASGLDLLTGGYYFADLRSHPNDMDLWDRQEITYAFDSSFDAAFRHPAIKEQVRRALATWNTALMTAPGGTYAYRRQSGFQPFGDIRTITMHEAGHVLGLAHPDQATAVFRNFAFDPMGTLITRTATTGEVMNAFVEPGDYNHILSWDELDGYRYGYTQPAHRYGQVVFREARDGEAPDVRIQAADLRRAGAWARAALEGGYRTSDRFQGIQLNRGYITFNSASRSPIGLKSLAINWDVTVSGAATRALQVETRGTDTAPLWHFDNDGPARFTYAGARVVSTDAKDDLIHEWNGPAGGDIPAGRLFHVGLEQDVWDWRLVRARAMAPSGAWSPVPMLGVHEWNRTIVRGTLGARSEQKAAPFLNGSFAQIAQAAGIGQGDERKPDACALEMSEDREVTARGFVIHAPDVASVVDHLSIATVDELELQLPSLNLPTMTKLAQQGRLQTFKAFGPYKLGPGQDLYVVLKGTEADLPEDVRKQGNYVLLNRPDLLDKELFVFLRSRTTAGDVEVGNYTLLGRKPITN